MIFAYRGSIWWSFIFKQLKTYKISVFLLPDSFVKIIICLFVSEYPGSNGDCTQNLEPLSAQPILFPLIFGIDNTVVK